MALICDSCGKGKLRGNRISHAHNVSKRVFNPNLHIFWVVTGGKRVKGRFCTKCLRRIKEQVSKAGNAPSLDFARDKQVSEAVQTSLTA